MEEAATANAIGAGTVIADTYRLEHSLGEGGMGLVFSAQHLRVPKRVAIKILRTALDADFLARFRQEAEIASRIGHPNIIDVLDFNTLPSGTPYLVMEHLDGESLATRARRGPLPLADALAILRQIASGLYAAHNAGVVHRDLKPENVFLVPREVEGTLTDHVKILDFGISKVHGSAIVRTSENVVMGTPRYMAPEQALGWNADIDGRADQFALAVIAFELLAGTPPFDDDNGTKVMFKIVHEEPRALAPLAPDTPPHVVAAINRALSKRPQDRFEDMSELAHALTGKPFVTTPGERARRASMPPAPIGDGVATAAASPRARIAEVVEAPATVADSPRARIVEAREAPAPVAAPPTDPSTTRSPRRWWPLAALLAVGAVGAFVLARTPDTNEPIEPSPPIAMPAVVAHDAPPATPDATSVVPVVEVPADAPVPATRKVATPPKPSALSPDAEARIQEAELLLAQGNLSAAEPAAQRALSESKHVRVYLVLVELACRGNDLASALSWLRAMPASARKTARKRCSTAGFPIDDPT